MIIGEVCLLTNDVRKLVDFYKGLLGVDNDNNDDTHQLIISEGTALTVYNDGTEKNNQNQSICLAFSVNDIDKEYRMVQALGAKIIEPPTIQPWSAVNMSFFDPHNNVIYLRQLQ